MRCGHRTILSAGNNFSSRDRDRQVSVLRYIEKSHVYTICLFGIADFNEKKF